MNGEKKCGRCKKVYNFTQFCINRKAKDGKNWICRSCQRELYVENRERRKEYARDYYYRVAKVKNK